jgi:E3 ubiquitin-protein ligase makorin
MTASSGDLQEYQQQQQQQPQQRQQRVAGGDGYGYYDQQGQWVNIEDPQSQAFLEQQYQLQQQQQQQQQYHHFQQQQQQQQQQRQVPRDVNAMFRPLEVGNASDQSYDQQRSFDAQIECSICLERVADESRPFSARRFGLLDKCDHSFCLSCIRGWRDGGVQGKEAGAIATEQTRMCPICRVNSFFITPSAHFPRTPEEKEEILKNYLSKMKQIPCKHYNNGRCPFGTSCFYSHGSGEVDTGVRKTTTAGEELHILTTPTLADYLDVSKKVGGGGSR